MDRTLKSRSALVRHRNVLTRAERIQVLMDEDRWDAEKDCTVGEEECPF